MSTQPLWLKPQQLARDHATMINNAVQVSDTVFTRPTFATAAGDERKLRGIPAIARGVAGVIPGTSPHSIR